MAAASPARSLRVWRMGLMDYMAGLRLQQSMAVERRTGDIGDSLLVLQHFPVYTIGRRKPEGHFLSGEDTIKALNVDVVYVARGGEVTFHGPGQIVLYPILNLRGLKLGVRDYVEGLEDVMIKTAESYGVSARGRVSGRTGVWVEDRKLGAVGVQISGGVSTHGLALNVNPSLEYFDHIVPCGMRDLEVTSLEKELVGKAFVGIDEVAERIVKAFVDTFNMSAM